MQLISQSNVYGLPFPDLSSSYQGKVTERKKFVEKFHKLKRIFPRKLSVQTNNIAMPMASYRRRNESEILKQPVEDYMYLEENCSFETAIYA